MAKQADIREEMRRRMIENEHIRRGYDKEGKGASFDARYVFSLQDTPEGREEVVKRFYPEYKKGEDIGKEFEGNFFIKNKETKKWELFDPEGFDFMGDMIAENIKPTMQGIGGL